MTITSFFPAQELPKDLARKAIRKSYNGFFHFKNPAILKLALAYANLAFDLLRKSSAAYHNPEHSLNVLQCGLAILRGRNIVRGPVDENDWINFVISLCFHDVGYVRGICLNDNAQTQVISEAGETIDLSKEATDAALTPYHVTRGQIFIKERLHKDDILDPTFICDCISYTTFPIPTEQDTSRTTVEYPRLLQAADLIGQLGEQNYLHNLPALYSEFQETGTAEEISVTCAGDLRTNYPKFFWGAVYEHIADTIPLLDATPAGELWIATLYRNIFSEENRIQISRQTQLLLQEIFYTLKSSGSEYEIYSNLLRSVCDYYRYLIGHVYLVDESGEKLSSGGIWCTHDLDRLKFFKRFRVITEQLTFNKGEGMPGMVFGSNQPQWIPDLSALDVKSFPRADVCRELGLKAAIGFPISVDSKVIAVLEIFASEFHEPTEQDVRFMGYLTNLVGRLLTSRG